MSTHAAANPRAQSPRERISLTQFGLGFWQAWWTYALCGGDICPAEMTVFVIPASTFLLLATTFGYLLGMLAGLRPRLLASLSRTSALVLATVCCTAGSLGMACAALLGPAAPPGPAAPSVVPTLPEPGASALFAMGALAFSVGNAGLLTMWGERWSTLASGQVGRYLYMSYITAIAVFFALTPVPAAGRATIASLFPAVSALILHHSQSEPRREPPAARDYEQEHPALARPLVATLLLNAVWGLGLPCIAAVYAGAGDATLCGLAIAAACLAALVGYLAYARPAVEAFALETPVGVALISGLALTLLLPEGLSFVSYGLATLGGACLDMLVMLVACDMAYRLRRPAAVTLGCAMLVARTGSLAGRAVYDLAVAEQPANAPAAILACVIVVACCSLVVFNRSNLEALYRVRPALPRAETVADRCTALADDIGLTPRERQILGLIARGRSAPYIAQELGISAGTVKNHVSSIYRKADVADRQGLLNMLEHAGCDASCDRRDGSDGNERSEDIG